MSKSLPQRRMTSEEFLAWAGGQRAWSLRRPTSSPGSA